MDIRKVKKLIIKLTRNIFIGGSYSIPLYYIKQK